MSGRLRPLAGADPDREWVGPVVLALASIVLGWSSGWGSAVGVGIGLSGVLLFIALRLRRLGLGRAIPLGPPLATFGLLAVSLPLTPLSEIAAGLTGLSLLVALGRCGEGAPSAGRLADGLTLPAAALGIAFATALLFAPPQRLIGVAAILIAAAIAAVTYLFGTATDPDATRPAAS